MYPKKVHGKTARQWLIQFAQSYRRQHQVSGHVALEAIVDEAKGRSGTLVNYAASCYHQVDLERLIKAVEKPL
jgi:hypothetical protein